MKIEVLNHASIRLSGNKIIYFDPYEIKNDFNDATYIFITHDHYDHYDEESLKKVINKNTVLIIPSCLKEKAKYLTDKVYVVEPNKNYVINDISFETIPAYNIQKNFHEKQKQYLGYNVLIDNTKYYIMGDTDCTPEANNVKTDICFVPIGGTYTMDEVEASDYINYIKPKKAVPIHYGSIVGSMQCATNFKKLVNKEIEVEILI